MTRSRNDELVAERPEWRPLVEQVQAGGNSCIGVPSPEGVPTWSPDGRGHYCVLSSSGRNDGSARWTVYWAFGQGNKGKIRVGSYTAPKRHRRGRPRKTSEDVRELTVGVDERGRRIMRINGGRGNEWLVAVVIDAQGLPVPVPV